MKNYLLLVLFSVLTVGINAQDVLSEGQLTLELTEVKSDDPAAQQQMEMMKGMALNVTFKDGTSLTSMDMMGGMIKSTSLASDDGSGKLLMDMMGNKMYIPITKEDADKGKEQSAEMWENVDIAYDEADTKEIQGIKCHKMTVTPKDGSEGGMSLTGYVTKTIKAKSNVMGIDISEFDGFPLELTMGTPAGGMTFTATKFTTDAVDASIFELDTKGYKEMTFQEFMDMMSQMGGGGFGF